MDNLKHKVPEFGKNTISWQQSEGGRECGRIVRIVHNEPDDIIIRIHRISATHRGQLNDHFDAIEFIEIYFA